MPYNRGIHYSGFTPLGGVAPLKVCVGLGWGRHIEQYIGRDCGMDLKDIDQQLHTYGHLTCMEGTNDVVYKFTLLFGLVL